jgi:hypothetical protein
LLKWSKISAAFGVLITNPFTSPFIYGITFVVGTKLLGLKVTISFPDNFTWNIVKEMLKNAPVLFGALTVGGILVGLPLAILSYFLSFEEIMGFNNLKGSMSCRHSSILKERNMVADIQKMISVPVDGSENALKSLDYINPIFGPQHNLKTTLFYALPRLLPILLEESKKDGKTLKKQLTIRKTHCGRWIMPVSCSPALMRRLRYFIPNAT